MGSLHEAIRGGDEQEVARLIAEGADLTEKDAWRMTPLLAAMGKGSVPIIERLLAAGASVRDRDRRRNSPLHLAVQGDHLPVIARLLAAKSSVKVGNGVRETPLHLAVSARARQLLLSAGADINALDRDGRSVLLMAIKAQDVALVRALLDAGAKQEVPGCTDALEQAITSGSTEIAAVLLDAGASLSPPYGTPPLQEAIRSSSPAIFNLLLEKGAPIERRFTGDGELLEAALTSAEPMFLEALLDRGIDTSSRLENGWTPLHYAASSCPPSVVSRLLDAGLDPDAESADGQTPLAGACGNTDGFSEIVALLIAAGADINHASPDGQTPLFTAEWSNPAVSLPRFLALGADPMVSDARGWTLAHRVAATNHPDNLDRLPMLNLDAADHSGWTPLDCALRYRAGATTARLEERGAARTFRGALAAAIVDGDLDALTALIADGVDLAVLDRYLCGPLELAIQHRQLAAAALLLEQGVGVEPAPAEARHLPRGWGPMYRAASSGFIEGLELLREAGASLAPPIPEPLLVVTVRGRRASATEWLLRAGAPLDRTDERGWTALHYACSRSELELVETLLDAGADPGVGTLRGRRWAPEGATGLQLLQRYKTRIPGRLKKKLR